MIKFKAVDGTEPMVMKDNGELQFASDKIKEDFNKAEQNVNKVQDKQV